MTFHSSSLLLLVSLSYILCLEETTNSPVVELKQGKLRGFQETSTDGKAIFSFLGIPFAEPPLEKLRFEDPVKLDKWDGILEATKMPEMCTQVIMTDDAKGHLKVSGSEDCLYLNVFTPKDSFEGSLPVMVFIHGGAFRRGSASLYQSNALLNEDIVLVVIQYRLGAFGFLSTEDAGMPGNMGLKDQRIALQWVQDNIQEFGGDPSKVTIFGESAGACSVHLQMLSPGSKGLFNQAIVQSGTGLCPWCVSRDHRQYARTFGDKLECSLDNGSKYFKECLKKRDVLPIMFQMGYQYKWGTFPLNTVPRVDGDFLPDEPATLLKSGRYNKVNLMAGVMRDEGGLYTRLMYVHPRLKVVLSEQFSKNAPYSVMVEEEQDAANLSQVIYDFYLKEKRIDEDPMDELTEMFGNSFFHYGHDLATLIHARDEDMQLFLYQFDQRGQKSLMDLVKASTPTYYVSHGDDLFLLFTGGEFLGKQSEKDEDMALSRIVIKLWTNFAKFGNPTPQDSFDFVWNRATTENFEHLSITITPAMKSYNRKKMLDFWTSLNTRQNQLLFQNDDKVQIKPKDEL